MKPIPDEIKEDNWKLFEYVMNPDPAIASQYSVKWVTHLMITMEMGEITEHKQLLNEALGIARTALFEYNDNADPAHNGKSLQSVSDVVKLLGKFMYDDRFATRDKNAFTGR